MTIDTELQQAISHHQANRLEIAEQLYRSILMSEPDHPDANHNFGVLTLQKGDLAEGIAYLRAAVSAAPQRRNFWDSYVKVLAESGKHDEAQRASEVARQYGFVVRASDAARASALPSGTALDEANVGETVASIEALTTQGKHDEAETLAQQLVVTHPNHGSGWKALAYAHLRRGDLGKALAPLEKATALLPGDPELDRHLHAARAMHEGLQLDASGEFAEAGQRFQEVLEVYPDYPDANHRLGVVAIRLHRPADAIPLIGKAISTDPDNLQYWTHYIDALLQSDRLEAAWHALSAAQKRGLAGPQIDQLIGIMTAVSGGQTVKVPRPIARVVPAVSTARQDDAAKPAAATPVPPVQLTAEEEQQLHELARLFNEGDIETALQRARTAAGRFPQHGFPWKVITLSQQRLGHYDDALDSGARALELWPNDSETLLIVAGMYQARHKLREALALCEHLLTVHPNHGEGLRLMCVIKLDLGELDQAEQFGRRAIDAEPTALAFNSLGVTLMKLGRLDEAADLFNRGSERDPANALAYNNLAFSLTHSENATPAEVFAAHRRFARQFEAPLKPHWPHHRNSRDPQRQLRIGFISGDFCHHAVASFLEPVLAPLGRDSGLSLYAYSNTTIIDEVTARLRRQFEQWTEVVGMPDRAVAEKIRADGIDILIDLSGHTAQNSLVALAHKPAPVQASWIGYPGTTGLDAVDYFLADPFWVPTDQFRSQFTEKIVYLPAIAPFQAERLSPPVNMLPALHNGYVTFGSFNRLDKLRRDVIALWARLLRTLPDARLVIGAMPRDGGNGNLSQWFAQEGIAAERIDFRSRSPVPVYLQQHHLVDICLDSFPFSGLTTALHSLWMGLPTVTLPAHSVPSRSGLTAMSHVGLTQCIAVDEDDYVRKAVALASDLPALAELRRGMRERCAGSPMFQPDKIAEGVSRALRTMWRRWCDGLPAESFDVAALRAGAGEHAN
jgi:predicted O-linked N-acetylglucosamine transferase (SPINDLY family)/TolA-binding protein